MNKELTFNDLPMVVAQLRDEVVGMKQMIISLQSQNKPLTTTKLSSATSDAKGTNASIYEAIRKKVQEIADCGKNDSKDTI